MRRPALATMALEYNGRSYSIHHWPGFDVLTSRHYELLLAMRVMCKSADVMQQINATTEEMVSLLTDLSACGVVQAGDKSGRRTLRKGGLPNWLWRSFRDELYCHIRGKRRGQLGVVSVDKFMAECRRKRVPWIDWGKS